MANLTSKNDPLKWWNLSSFSWFLEKVRKKCKTSEDFAKFEVPPFQKKVSFQSPIARALSMLQSLMFRIFKQKSCVAAPHCGGIVILFWNASLTLHTFLMSYDGQKNFFRIILLPMSETERNGNAQKNEKTLSIDSPQTAPNIAWNPKCSQHRLMKCIQDRRKYQNAISIDSISNMLTTSSSVHHRH